MEVVHSVEMEKAFINTILEKMGNGMDLSKLENSHIHMQKS
jgi:hypothetical protein